MKFSVKTWAPEYGTGLGPEQMEAARVPVARLVRL